MFEFIMHSTVKHRLNQRCGWWRLGDDGIGEMISGGVWKYWWMQHLWRIVWWHSRWQEMSSRKCADRSWDWHKLWGTVKRSWLQDRNEREGCYGEINSRIHIHIQLSDGHFPSTCSPRWKFQSFPAGYFPIVYSISMF